IKEGGKGINALIEQMRIHNNKLTEDQQKQWDEYIEMVANANLQLQIIENKAAAEREKKRKEEMLKEAGDLFKLQQFRLQTAIKHQEEIIQNDEKSAEQRYNATKKAAELRIRLAFLESREALRAEGLTSSARQLIREKL